MKKSSLLLVMTMLIIAMGFSSGQAEAQSKFKDVSDSYWAASSIQYLTGKQIIQGYKDGSFKPGDKLTRIQVAMMVSRDRKYSTANRPDPVLKDVKKGSKYYDVVSAIMAEDVFKGVVKDGQFKPGANVTRAEMAAILANAYQLSGSYTHSFVDVPSSHWAYKAVQAIVMNRITDGYTDGTYRPNELLTRAQFSVFMTRVLDESYRPSAPVKPELPTQPTGKVYPDGWTAPVLKSSYIGNSIAQRLIFEKELGFYYNPQNATAGYGIKYGPSAISLMYDSQNYDVQIGFEMWDGDSNGLIKEAYRIPIVAKELFKFYFEEDADKVWNYFDQGKIPTEFIANGKVAKASRSVGGVTYLQIGFKGRDF